MHVAALILASFLALTSASSEKKVVCYFGSWAVYRPGNGKIDISEIDPTLCTHLIYTFVGIGEDGSVRILDSWADLAKDYGKDGYGRFNQLRSKNPKLKTMIAIGGWNEGSTKYSHVVANPTIRKSFVDNVVNFVKKYGFDGFDMDWEYPNQRGGNEADKENYVLLLKELREKFDAEGLILSAAVGAAEVSASKSYIISEMSKYLHFINLMTYDLHGTWDKKTGINAPLYAGSWENDAERKLNVNASVHYWLEQGAPAEKLVVGVPFYGRGFTLSSSQQKQIGAPSEQPGTAGPYTREPGMLGYNEICEKFINENWEVRFQEEQRVPYAVSGNQWVGYDDQRSLREKAEFVNKLGLGGMMVWSVETDDFKGLCGKKYPLLRTINYFLDTGVTSVDSPTENTPTEEQTIKPSNETTTPSPAPSTESSVKPEKPTEEKTEQKQKKVCKTEGWVRDSEKCEVFYYCERDGSGFRQFDFVCPQQLVFDLKTNTCNFEKFVGC